MKKIDYDLTLIDMSGNDSNDLLRIGTGKVNRVYP